MYVRYFNKDTNKIREDFLQFFPVNDMSGKGLAQVLLVSLRNLAMNSNYFRGQGYDGTSAMRMLFNGMQANNNNILSINIVHTLQLPFINLTISDVRDIKLIRNAVGLELFRQYAVF